MGCGREQKPSIKHALSQRERKTTTNNKARSHRDQAKCMQHSEAAKSSSSALKNETRAASNDREGDCRLEDAASDQRPGPEIKSREVELGSHTELEGSVVLLNVLGCRLTY